MYSTIIHFNPPQSYSISCCYLAHELTKTPLRVCLLANGSDIKEIAMATPQGKRVSHLIEQREGLRKCEGVLQLSSDAYHLEGWGHHESIIGRSSASPKQCVCHNPLVMYVFVFGSSEGS